MPGPGPTVSRVVADPPERRADRPVRPRGQIRLTAVRGVGWVDSATSQCQDRRTRGGEPCPCDPSTIFGKVTRLVFARSFRCANCGHDVSLDAPGTSHRNHCPRCLWSRHLDRNVPGDRKAECPGGMEPIAVTVRGERRWVLIHRCTRCGRLRLNKTAADDNMLLLMQLAALPLAMPPVPYGVAVTRTDDADELVA